MLEHDVQSAIIDMLKVHPKIAWAARFNSGGFTGSYNGKKRFVRFNMLEGCPDIIGQIIDGRIFMAEIKAKPFKKPSDEREEKQLALINKVNANNGVGMFAWNVQMVLDKLASI